LDQYIEYAAQRTDAPREFHEAVGLAIMSGAVGRKIYLQASTGVVYPALWVLLIADSTLYRKSTALDLGRELLEAVDEDALAPSDFTPQRFVAILAEHDGRPLAFFRDEVAGFWETLNRLDFMAGLKDVLLNVYDGRPFRREKMKPPPKKEKNPRGPTDDTPEPEWRFNIRHPFLTMAVATTRDRFTQVAQLADLHNGFLPRHAFVVPPPRPHRRLPLRAMDSAIDGARGALIKELTALARRGGEVAAGPQVWTRFNAYLEDLEAEAQHAPDRNVVAIVGSRISWMALRVALLLATADQARMISLPHLLRGILITEVWRHNAIDLLGALGTSRFEKRASRLAELVHAAGAISRRDAMRAMKASKREMDDLQATLSDRGEIIVETRSTAGGPTAWFVTLSPLSTLSPGLFLHPDGKGPR